MAVLELPVPEGALTLPVPSAGHRWVDPAVQRFSSPEARPRDGGEPDDAATALADELGSSERAFRAGHGMLRRHLAKAGEGYAASLTATLVGMRRVTLRAAGLMVRGRTDDLRVGVALVADPLVVLAIGGAKRVLHWSLMPGGPSVTARADGLRFLRALATGGQLFFQMGRRVDLPPLEVDADGWEYEEEWSLFEDLATLEEWSGVTIPMPEEVAADEARTAAQAAIWARTKLVPARLTEAISFTTADALAEEPDELRLHQSFAVDLLGVEVPLGEGVVSVKLASVEQDRSPAHVGLRYRARPIESDIVFQLRPPSTRRLPPHRTQPERIAPPPFDSPSERPAHANFVRRSQRSLANVLAERPARHLLRQTSDTQRLLDDLRGT